MNWDIVAIMDKMIEKATTYKWPQLDSIQREYAIFVESESNDRKDAVVEGVDLSNADSLFRETYPDLWCLEAISKRTEEQHLKDEFTMVLRNINMFPLDDYRCARTWELMQKMSSFVVKAPTDIVGLSFDNLSDVSLWMRSNG